MRSAAYSRRASGESIAIVDLTICVRNDRRQRQFSHRFDDGRCIDGRHASLLEQLQLCRARRAASLGANSTDLHRMLERGNVLFCKAHALAQCDDIEMRRK